MSAVAEFERTFADFVGAKFAIALCNGTATLHTALGALGVKPGDRVAVPPLTMSATTIAVLHAGAVPVFVDVDPETWVMHPSEHDRSLATKIPVALYGLHTPWRGVVDAALPQERGNTSDEGAIADAQNGYRPLRGFFDDIHSAF